VGRRVVLLASMLGAGCAETANKLSGLLGMEVVNSERVFREIVAQERISFAELSMRARFGEVDIEDLVKSVVEDHISEGGVIVESRVALLVLKSLDKALEAVDESDEERASPVRRLYKRDWLDAGLCDLVVNTSK